MPDQVLELAVEEIQAILKKYDLAGLILLNSKTHGEYFYALEPAWSCVKLLEDGKVRVRCKREDYNTVEEHKQAMEWTVGMIASLQELAFTASDRLLGLLAIIATKIDFDHETVEDTIRYPKVPFFRVGHTEPFARETPEGWVLYQKCAHNRGCEPEAWVMPEHFRKSHEHLAQRANLTGTGREFELNEPVRICNLADQESKVAQACDHGG